MSLKQELSNCGPRADGGPFFFGHFVRPWKFWGSWMAQPAGNLLSVLSKIYKTANTILKNMSQQLFEVTCDKLKESKLKSGSVFAEQIKIVFF